MDRIREEKRLRELASTLLWVALLVCLATLQFDGGLSFAESVTAWISGSGVGEAMKRSVAFLPNSPLYTCFIAWWLRLVEGVATSAGAHSEIHIAEWILRGPSILATIFLFACVYKLARTALTPMPAWACVIALTLSPTFTTFLISATPFSFALCFTVIATYVWIKLLERRTVLLLAAHLAVSMLAVFFDYGTIILIGPGHILLWLIADKTRRPSLRALSFYISVLLVIMAPAILHLVELQRRPELSHHLDVFKVFASEQNLWAYGATILIGLLGIKYTQSSAVGENSNDRQLIYLGIIWWLASFVPFLIPSSILNLNHSNFYYGFLGLAFIIGGILRNAGSRAFVLVATISLVMTLLAPKTTEHWREAAKFLQSKLDNKPVVVLSGLPEAEFRPFFTRPGAGEYLAAPFKFYSISRQVIPSGFSNIVEAVDPAFDGYLVLAEGGENGIEDSRLTVMSADYALPLVLECSAQL